MSVKLETSARLPFAIRLIAAFYFLLAAGVGMFSSWQLSVSRSDTELFGTQPAFGSDFPQGETVMPNGEHYVRQGNLVTTRPKDGGESLGWYVGDDPRAMGGGLGTGPGRFSWELFLVACVAIAGCCGIGLCFIVHRPWAWRVVHASQNLAMSVGLLFGTFYLALTLWALSQGGLGGGIALAVVPFTIGVPLVVSGVALSALRYLHRPAVRIAYGFADVDFGPFAERSV